MLVPVTESMLTPLRDAVDRLGSITRVAKTLGIDKSTLSRLLSGKQGSTTLRTLDRIARLPGVTLTELGYQTELDLGTDTVEEAQLELAQNIAEIRSELGTTLTGLEGYAVVRVELRRNGSLQRVYQRRFRLRQRSIADSHLSPEP